MIFGSEKNPKGPDWSKAQIVVKDLSIATLKFKVPPSSPPFPDRNWACEDDHFPLPDFNLIDQKYLEEYENRHSTIIYSNSWKYRGLPVLQGYCGDIRFFITASRLINPAINCTLFSPEEMANAIIKEHDSSFISKHHKARFDDPYDLTDIKWPNYLAPINSQWVDKGNTRWLYCEAQPLVNGKTIITFYTPLSHDVYISFQFLISRSAINAGNPYRIEDRVPLTNFTSLIDKIMDSVELDLPPEASELKTWNSKDSSDMPVIEASPDYIELAKHVLYMWSAREYTDTKSPKKSDHRADKGDVSSFIESKINPRPLPGSIPRGNIIYRYFDANQSGEKDTNSTSPLLPVE